MAFYFSKRKLRPAEEEEVGELNIVPYLDILMNLIIFMLLSMTGLAAFGVLNVNAPNYGGPSAGAVADNPDAPKLLLTVLISKKGHFVAGAGAVLGQAPGAAQPTTSADGEPTVPKKGDGTYDYGALTAMMLKVKGEFPSETKVIIAAEADVPYENLVETMDAIRETKDRKVLFSDVTLATM